MKAVSLISDNAVKEGQEYYVFANGDLHFYISRFNRKSAHCGCYPKEDFKVIERDPEPPEKSVALDQEKRYKADLIWRSVGYKQTELKSYYIRPGKTHVYFYHDREFERLGGCFPAHWFDGYEEIETIDTEEDSEETGEQTEFEQLSLF